MKLLQTGRCKCGSVLTLLEESAAVPLVVTHDAAGNCSGFDALLSATGDPSASLKLILKTFTDLDVDPKRDYRLERRPVEATRFIDKACSRLVREIHVIAGGAPHPTTRDRLLEELVRLRLRYARDGLSPQQILSALLSFSAISAVVLGATRQQFKKLAGAAFEEAWKVKRG